MKPLDTNTQAKKANIKNDTVFIQSVLTHYKAHGRHDLVWRKKISAYRILVSEIMLQQTQVSRVVPKFELWMKRYPTLSALSKASLADILKLWQGLGYQRRAKALFEVAQTSQSIPKTYDKLLMLKGIGPYTASAVCAFAYNIFPEKLLETNIRTALIEEFHLPAMPAHAGQAGQGVVKVHDGLLYDDLNRLNHHLLVQDIGAREWYYALMDYGAHLKTLRISHNEKSSHYTKQTPYEGSSRQLRAKVLFAVTHHEKLPQDERLESVINQLTKEGYIIKKGRGYSVV